MRAFEIINESLTMKRLKRIHQNRVIAGVCVGFGDYFNIDPALVRLVWVFFTLFGGTGILAYIIAMIIIPDEFTFEEKKSFSTKKRSGFNSTFWGIILIIVGLILFVQHGPLIRVFFHSFWGAGINIILAVTLIMVGVYFVYSKKDNLWSAFESEYTSKMHLSETDKKLFGVCGGIAETLQIDSTIVRFIWVFVTFMSVGAGIILYLLLAMIVPRSQHKEKDTA